MSSLPLSQMASADGAKPAQCAKCLKIGFCFPCPKCKCKYYCGEECRSAHKQIHDKKCLEMSVFGSSDDAQYTHRMMKATAPLLTLQPAAAHWDKMSRTGYMMLVQTERALADSECKSLLWSVGDAALAALLHKGREEVADKRFSASLQRQGSLRDIHGKEIHPPSGFLHIRTQCGKFYTDAFVEVPRASTSGASASSPTVKSDPK